MSNVIITGSSGQIGTNLGLALLARGDAVHGFDRRRNPWTDDILTTWRDLADPFLSVPPGGASCVVHLAAHAKVHATVTRPFMALENIQMTFNVLEYCRKHNLPIVYASSREVYGDVRRFLTEESYADFNLTESPYSASKLAGEALVYSYARCYGLRYIVFRFSNVYGRYDNDLERMERVIPLFIRRIAQGEPVTVYGPDKVLDFTYVDDCVRGVLAGVDLLTEGKAVNETINLAYGRGHTLGQLAGYIGEALGVEPAVTYEPARVGEVTHYVANIGKARALLGYEPRVSLREGVRLAVEWTYGHNATGDGRTNGAGAPDARHDDPIPQGAGR